MEELATEVEKIKQVLIGFTYLQPGSNKQIMYNVPTNFDAKNVITNMGRVIDGYCRTQISQLPNMTKELQLYEQRLHNAEEQIGHVLKQCQESITSRESAIQSQLDELHMTISNQLGSRRCEQAELVEVRVNKLNEAVSLMNKSHQLEISKVEKKTMAYCVRLDEKIMAVQTNTDKAKEEQTRSQSMMSDKISSFLNQFQNGIDRMRNDIQSISLVIQKKADQADLKMIEQQIKVVPTPQDLLAVQNHLSDCEIDIQKYQKDVDTSLHKMKSTLNQLDYTLMSKANKMDYQIIYERQNNVQQTVERFRATLDDTIADYHRFEEQLKLNLTSLGRQIESHLLDQVQTQGKQSIQNLIKEAINKYDVKGIYQSYEQLHNTIESKADQSQFAEIMQAKASVQTTQQLQKLVNELKHSLKIILDNMLLFFDSHNETDSLNIRRSDMQKAIYNLKNLGSSFSLRQRTISTDSVNVNVNVKLRPTLYRTQQVLKQSRSKTEQHQ